MGISWQANLDLYHLCTLRSFIMYRVLKPIVSVICRDGGSCRHSCLEIRAEHHLNLSCGNESPNRCFNLISSSCITTHTSSVIIACIDLLSEHLRYHRRRKPSLVAPQRATATMNRPGTVALVCSPFPTAHPAIGRPPALELAAISCWV